MALVLPREDQLRLKRDGMETLQFKLIFAVCFAVFLTAALLERLMPWMWRREKKSSVTRAWNSARTCTTYAFMG